MEKNKILVGDNIETLKTIPDNSIDCCITSPPYYGLRDYGTAKWVGGDPNCPHKRMNKTGNNTSTGHAQDGLKGNVGDSIYKTVCPKCGAIREDKQVGLEETPEEYIDRLVNIFREVKRVLKDDGTLWVNIGDSYNSSGHSRNEDGSITFSEKAQKQSTNKGSYDGFYDKKVVSSCKPKDLIGIPWMLAFALRQDGWYLRSDIIWQKPNPMPESVEDRCTKAHEYIFMLSKSLNYYFDYEAIQEQASVQKITSEIRFGGNKYPDNVENRLYSGNVYKGSKYNNKDQESSVRQGINKLRGNGVVELRKNLPNKQEFLLFVKNVKVKAVADCGVVQSTAEHWYRSDNGFSYPTIEDWEKCKHLFTEIDGYEQIDKMLTDVTYETDAVGKNSIRTKNCQYDGQKPNSMHVNRENGGKDKQYLVRRKRDVWTINPSTFKGAHFATFPEELVANCLLAGCPKDGIVLDPFFGSGTVGVVAKKHHRNYIGCELNEEYVKMAEKRLKSTRKSLF